MINKNGVFCVDNMMRPSFLGLIATGFINLLAVVMLLLHLPSFTPVMLVPVLLLLGISIGVHSLLHFQEEVHYDFNPLEGKWVPAEEFYQHTQVDRAS